MAKKVLLLSLVTVLTALWASAQHAVGDWRIHTSFVGDNVMAVAEGNQWVYYLSGGNLFRLDKETKENESLNIMNDLSDMTISQIYYNNERDYLVVIYSNTNIDIILSDGQVINMPEVKDAVLTASKAINDVTFADGLIYLATGFGYVVIDDKRFVVKESHIYGTPLTTVAQIDKWLLLSTESDLYYGLASDYHEQLESFKTVSFHKNCIIRSITDSTLFCVTGGNTYFGTLKPMSDDKLKIDGSTIIDQKTSILQPTRDGWLLWVPKENQCYKTDAEGKNPVVIDTEGEMCSANPRGDGKLWLAGPQGLHLQGEGNYFLPNALSFKNPYWMTYNKQQDKLYVSSPTANVHFGDPLPSYINTYDGIMWHDVTPEGAPATGTYWIEFMPGESDTYFIGTWTKGLLKVYQDEIVFKYDTTNSPISYRGGAMHPVTSMDRNGNLWVVQPYESSEHPAMVLPAAKTKLNQSTADDWFLPQIDGLTSTDSQRSSFISTKRGSQDIKIFNDGNFRTPLFIWNTNGTMSTKPPQVALKSLNDQDGEQISWTNILCLAEDLSGNVWMGSTEGICYFNPNQDLNPNTFKAVRPKVPRNDGTGYADRLMDGIQVNCIDVDGANRKWIGTESSGLFLVSADGSVVIDRFNSTNSPLASNTIYRVCCNPNSNSVYVTTPAGLYEYFSDSSPAASSYSDILAFPNPVRPDYGGDVTITGLMEGSLVKIADASGNVIRQLKSTGGMVTWDCRDESGEQVKSGVYLVLCSQSSGSGKAAVTKIAVIR